MQVAGVITTGPGDMPSWRSPSDKRTAMDTIKDEVHEVASVVSYKYTMDTGQSFLGPDLFPEP